MNDPSPRSGVIRAYLNRRSAVLLILGFASGLPLELTAGTLAARLKDRGMDVAAIGAFGLVALPYALKFLWSPAIDAFVPPLLGRRRGWLLIAQLGLIASILLMARDPAPGGGVAGLVVAATAVAFWSATQDVVIDAYRTDVLPPDERGPGSAVFVAGYRVAMIASGAGALILAGRMGWSWPAVYRASAACVGVGLIATLLAPEPPAAHAPRGAGGAIVAPLRDLLLRRGGAVALLFVFLFKLPEYLAAAMTVPFMLDLGISKADIGAIRQGLGVVVTIVGAFVGGGVVTRWGVWRSLWLFGLLHSVSNLAFLYLAHAGPRHGPTVAAIGVENFCVGLTTAGFAAYLIGQCDPRHSATQFALLSGLMALCRTASAPLAGAMAQRLGWQGFFVATALAGLPGIALLLFLKAEPTDADDARPPRGFDVAAAVAETSDADVP